MSEKINLPDWATGDSSVRAGSATPTEEFIWHYEPTDEFGGDKRFTERLEKMLAYEIERKESGENGFCYWAETNMFSR